MRLHLVLVLFLAFACADQFAISENGIMVILKDNGTWETIDTVSVIISKKGITKDSLNVILNEDNTWEYTDTASSILHVESTDYQIGYIDGINFGNKQRHSITAIAGLCGAGVVSTIGALGTACCMNIPGESDSIAEGINCLGLNDEDTQTRLENPFVLGGIACSALISGFAGGFCLSTIFTDADEIPPYGCLGKSEEYMSGYVKGFKEADKRRKRKVFFEAVIYASTISACSHPALLLLASNCDANTPGICEGLIYSPVGP